VDLQSGGTVGYLVSTYYSLVVFSNPKLQSFCSASDDVTDLDPSAQSTAIRLVIAILPWNTFLACLGPKRS
jgi:hypothetical protein